MAIIINEVREIAFHRNGIDGTGFYVCLFTYLEPGHQWLSSMLAIVFPEPGHCAVLSHDSLVCWDISFGSNSYQGDLFEPELRRIIKEYEESRK